MYQVSFKVKDLDGFSFSVEQMDRVLRPDAQRDNGDSFLMESIDKTMNGIVRCDFCYALQKLGDLADIIVTDRTDANGYAITYNMCLECKERQALENEAANLQSELEIKTSPNRYHPGTPERFHQRHNPGGPDENPKHPGPSIVIKYNNTTVTGPCGVCDEPYRPEIGRQLFLEGTQIPVCLPCGERFAPELVDALPVPF
jgi:hypothetical protein